MQKLGADQENWDMEADVVVVGAGDAGLAAAIEAADAGARTIVFDKMSSTGTTSSALSGGGIAFAGTDYQKSQGVEDSNKLFYRDMMETGEGQNDRNLVELMISHQLDTYYWLMGFGVKWNTLWRVVGMSVARLHNTDPVEHVKLLLKAARDRGAHVRFRTKVRELIIGDNGTVAGVAIESDGVIHRVKAEKGVILATGGFGRDKERLFAIDPRLANIKVTVSAGHTGDGHRMAEGLGAGFVHMTLDSTKPSIGRPPTGNVGLTAFRLGAILVNKQGRRFVDESGQDRALGIATLQQPDGVVYEIFDRKILEKEQEKRPDVKERLGNLLVEAGNPEELAEKIGLPADALIKTIEQYNADVANGKDELFGRTHVIPGIGNLVKIDAPPFSAFATVPRLSFTVGGVKVDSDMHILNSKGEAIPGLYGAGELVGGFHGAGYHVGSAITKALVSGRIAGRNAASGK